ncbi:MAG TPA: hypothetical protein VE548_02755 [Nitrososphaeraceae archaeon]|jgi:hypothetical protein|nr:hypothetical protein [Nitrososphaeraceae archaeon]
MESSFSHDAATVTTAYTHTDLFDPGAQIFRILHNKMWMMTTKMEKLDYGTFHERIANGVCSRIK